MDIPHDPALHILSTRLFSAPRDLVWRAWTDPEHLARWWGPKGFRNTFLNFDFQVGGSWKFIMHGPDGTDYPNENIFVEIVRPERIVFDHVMPPFRVIATFTEEEGKTRVTFRMLFKTAQECDAKRQYVVPGNEQNFDRLEVVLAELQTVES